MMLSATALDEMDFFVNVNRIPPIHFRLLAVTAETEMVLD